MRTKRASVEREGVMGCSLMSGRSSSVVGWLAFALLICAATPAHAQWPIDYGANRRHMLSFDAIVLKGADHFLMMDRSAEFNRALEKAIRALSEKKSEGDGA